MHVGVIWEGEPLLYRRKRGFGLIIRDLHYLFDVSGRIERITGINAKVLKIVVERTVKDKDPDLLMLAHMRTRGRAKARMETRKQKLPGRGAVK